MDILVTGGAGFIGSHLADHLIAQGHHVVVLDNLSTGRKENIAHQCEQKRFQFVEGSILDSDIVDPLVAQSDSVYHLAAAVGVDLIMRQPLESLRTNMLGTEIVLEAVRRHRKRVLIASTSEVYGKNTSSGLEEDADRMYGATTKHRWSYASAKAMDELWAYLAWKEQGVETVIVRLFNTVGPRQTGAYGMVIPRLVDQALAGEPLTIYGDGQQRRCFLHVTDCVQAMSGLMREHAAVGGMFNIGNPCEISINDLATKVLQHTASSSRLHYVPYEQAYGSGYEDMRRRHPCICRIQKLTGWTPTLTIDDMITSVVSYERQRMK